MITEQIWTILARVGWAKLMAGLVVGVCLHASVAHFLIGWRRWPDKVYLLFALLCLNIAAYTVFLYLLYHTEALPLSILLLKCAWSLAALFAILLVWFVSAYTGYRPMKVLVVISLFYGTMIFLNAVLPHGVIYSEITAVGTIVLSHGDRLFFPVGQTSFFKVLLEPAFFLVFLYAMAACAVHYRSGERGAAISLGIAIGVFYLFRLHDVFQTIGFLKHIRLLEFGFLFMVLVIGYRLSGEQTLWIFHEGFGRYTRLEEGLKDEYFVFSHLEDETVVYLSASTDALTGWKRLDLVGKRWLDSVPVSAEQEQQLLTQYWICEYERRMVTYEFEYTDPEKGKQVLEVRAWPVWNEQGGLERFEGIARNINARKKAEAELRHAEKILEKHVQERTAELKEINRALAQEIQERESIEEAVRASERRYREIVEEQRELIGRCRPDTTITFVNSALCWFMGKTAEELKGTSVLDELLSPDRFRVEQFFEGLSRGVMQTSLEVQVSTPNREHCWYQWRLHAVEDEDNNIIEVQGVGRDISDRKRLEEALVRMTEAERHRISQDLHDGIGQNLTGLQCLSASLAQKIPPDDHQELALAEAITAGLQKALIDTKDLVRTLKPVVDDAAGLTVALARMVKKLQQDHPPITFTFRHSEALLVHQQKIAYNLYRIAQNALDNVVKHSEATQVTINLSATPYGICLCIDDNGIGLAEEARKKGGWGINFMRYRADSIRGLLRILPSASGGVLVQCRVPLSGVKNIVRNRPAQKCSSG